MHASMASKFFVAVLLHLLYCSTRGQARASSFQTFKLSNGDVITCVEIEKQVSVKGNNLTVQRKPLSSSAHHPPNSSVYSTFSQLFWTEVGSCDEGKIPLLRTNNKTVSGTKSYPNDGTIVAAESGQTHEHAAVEADGSGYRGLRTTISIWEPKVEANDFSLSQIWLLTSKEGVVSTMEAGWQIYPSQYGGYDPRLFVYWTKDSYKNTGCYNLECPGFVQVSNKYVLGGAISHDYSQVGSTQTEIEFLVSQDKQTGNWWLKIGGDDIGYWPASLLPDFNDGASMLQFGGEVYYNKVPGVSHTTTQMGSGNFPEGGYQQAAYQRLIQGLDGNLSWQQIPLHALNPEAAGCYNVGQPMTSSNWGAYFFYGGPGYSSTCP